MKYAIVYVICIVCLFGVGVLMWRIAISTHHSERGSAITLQTLVESWKTSGAYNSVEDPATEADIKKAEATIGAPLPTSLREVYQLSVFSARSTEFVIQTIIMHPPQIIVTFSIN